MDFRHALTFGAFLAFVSGLGTGCHGGRSVDAATAATAATDANKLWTDENGEAMSLASFRGAPFILTAGYTSCTVRCPLTVDKLVGVEKHLRLQGRNVPILFLTLDPRADTTQRLARWKSAHHLSADWHMLRGDDADTRALARVMGVHAAYDDGHIDHDVRIAVFDANGHITRTFDGWSFNAEDVLTP